MHSQLIMKNGISRYEFNSYFLKYDLQYLISDHKIIVDQFHMESFKFRSNLFLKDQYHFSYESSAFIFHLVDQFHRLLYGYGNYFISTCLFRQIKGFLIINFDFFLSIFLTK